MRLKIATLLLKIESPRGLKITRILLKINQGGGGIGLKIG